MAYGPPRPPLALVHKSNLMLFANHAVDMLHVLTPSSTSTKMAVLKLETQ